MFDVLCKYFRNFALLMSPNTAVQNIIVYNNNMTFPAERSVDNSHRGVLYPIVLISIFNPTSHTRVPLGLRWCHRFMTLLPTQWHTYCVVQNTINLSCFLINCQPLPPPLVSCHVTWDQTSTWESRFCLFIKMSPESGPGLNFSACFIFPVLQRFE